MVETVLSESIIGRARAAGIIEVHTHDIRNYSENKHRRVDDTPYGGGMGMLMSPVPIYNCYKSVIESMKDLPYKKRRVIYMSPQGRMLTQEKARSLLEYDNIIILCGHYEGVDQRVLDEIVDEEISVGDYVLTGGELPACILVDAVSRMIDGVLRDKECYEEESIASGMLEYPQYTRPYNFLGRTVPDVLLSGHHANIDKWRREQALKKTLACRPDLIEKNTGKEK